jgi:hypothetical protein
VWPLRYAVVAALVSALVPTGALPVHHLHPATPARPTIVHAHADYGAAADVHSPPTVDDEHDDSVPLSQVMAGGQARRVVGQPCVLPHQTWVTVSAASEAIRPDLEVRPTPSPPPRPSAPRAPPA